MVRPLTQDWEFNVLGIENYRRRGRLRTYFDFIMDHQQIPGDICEAGVYKGRSLLATALLLKDIGSDKKVYGFDSFKGMPEPSQLDSLGTFDALRKQDRISEDHYRQLLRFWGFRAFMLRKRPTLKTVSMYAGDMSDPGHDELKRKIAFLNLDNIVLVEGLFEDTMPGRDYKWMAALVDCDLYESYRACLPHIWEALSPGGLVFLDEYYSLKFPGARLAVDQFFADKVDGPEFLSAKRGQFERWGVYKRA
jgi:hypothetical protein